MLERAVDSFSDVTIDRDPTESNTPPPAHTQGFVGIVYQACHDIQRGAQAALRLAGLSRDLWPDR
jgi:hypothetical protein